MSDSAYEYLPKQYLLLGGALEQPRKMYEQFIDVAQEHLLHRALHPGNLPIRFFGDAHVSKPPKGERIVTTTPRTQHLTCFTGGMVGMAAKIFDRPADLKVAAELTDGCVWSYSGTPSGIAPEIFYYIPCVSDSENDDCRWSDSRVSYLHDKFLVSAGSGSCLSRVVSWKPRVFRTSLHHFRN